MGRALVVDGPNDGQFFCLPGQQGKVFGNPKASCGRGNGFEGTADFGGGVRLWIKRVNVAHSAPTIDNDAGFGRGGLCVFPAGFQLQELSKGNPKETKAGGKHLASGQARNDGERILPSPVIHEKTPTPFCVLGFQALVA